MSTDNTPTLPPLKLPSNTLKSSTASTDILKTWPINQDDESETSSDNDKEVNPLPKNNSPNKEGNIKYLKKIPSVLADHIAERKYTFSKDTPSQRISNEDVKALFGEEKSKFIGNFLTDNFRLMKGYLTGNQPLLRLYYTKLEPNEKKLASLCIVHGFGEHSGRFMDVSFSSS